MSISTDTRKNKEIDSSENLGRGVFSGRDAKKACRNSFPVSIFLEKEGVIEISVDRLDLAPHSVIAEIGDKIAKERDENRKFYGWAVVKAENACDKGRKVLPTPTPKNPYHADIILPEEAKQDREIQKQHALSLAENSKWLKRP